MSIKSFSDNSQQYHEKGGKWSQSDQIISTKFAILTPFSFNQVLQRYLWTFFMIKIASYSTGLFPRLNSISLAEIQKFFHQ